MAISVLALSRLWMYSHFHQNLIFPGLLTKLNIPFGLKFKIQGTQPCSPYSDGFPDEDNGSFGLVPCPASCLTWADTMQSPISLSGAPCRPRDQPSWSSYRTRACDRTGPRSQQNTLFSVLSHYIRVFSIAHAGWDFHMSQEHKFH